MTIDQNAPQPSPALMVLKLTALHATAQNPRADGDNDLDGLAASMACEREPYLIQPPTVEEAEAGTYRILSGERRVRGARLAGWTTIACLVLPAPEPLAALALRLVENLHRRDLHPLDTATALKVAWLAENAMALGAAEAALSALSEERQPHQTLVAMTAIANEAGFITTHPAVPWSALLERLGLAVDRERIKKLLQVLNLAPDVVATVRSCGLSEAALRALGSLDVPDQRLVVAALADDPTLARKLRRVARLVREGGYPVAQALAEVRGEVYQGEESLPAPQADAPGAMKQATNCCVGEAATPTVAPDCADAVLRLVELAEQFAAARAHLSTTIGGAAPERLPHPWGALVAEALTLARSD